ncbi:bifunctional nuclease family protein [Spirosoma sp. BT702]|uniref:Bifunctional nuclease family protein n=1 Tax=Spirosoma profusum TaxID=2771354 RepID=A0A926Y2W1_9BACT|nr:bifunctional nuclease family protein [Spirosoma profusum]MBD2702843.1 bifunctional nuclease family protein [Spirosoma profusum]
MDKIKLEILGLSPSQSQSGSFALVLGEEYGNRRLPIIIGMFEAQAIAIEIEKIVPNRPMTHDLFKQFAEHFKFTVREIMISDLREGIFFAKIVCFDGVRESVIDARPSDAIAIGIRFDVPIYTNESILSEAGITANGNDEDEEQEELVRSSNRPTARSFSDQLKNASSEELQRMLEEALGNEEYERAAKIRDEMSKRN